MKKTNKTLSILLIIAVFAVSLSFSGCVDNDYEKRGGVFGVLSCDVLIYGGNSQKAGKEIFKLMEDIDYAVSTSNHASPVYKFNYNNEKTVSDRYEISALAYEIAVNCMKIYEEDKIKIFSPVVNGLVSVFNPAIYPLVEAWGVSSNTLNEKKSETGFLPPDEETIARYLKYCRYDYLDIIKEGEGSRTKYYFAVKAVALAENADSRALKIDFGGYAKGYAADKAAEICKKYGVKYGSVNISGNVIMINERPGGEDWPVRIGNPFEAKDSIEFFCRFTTKACSPVSSGVYERYYSLKTNGEWKGTYKNAPIFNDGGVYVTHIIDPSTGWPVNLEKTQSGVYYNTVSGIVNATVFSESSAVADAYATAVTILGIKDGIEFLKEKGLRGIIVTGDGNGENREYAVVGSIPLAEDGNEKFAHTSCGLYEPAYDFNK